MKNIHRVFGGAFSWVLILIATGHAAVASAAGDPQAMIKETQQVINQDNRLTFVWWTPWQFWQLSFEKGGQLTPQAIDGFLKVIRPYTIFLIADGKMGPGAALTYFDEATLRKSIVATDPAKKTYAPIELDKLDPDLKNFLQMMGPVLTNMLGQFGTNMHFVVFKTGTAQGTNAVDVEKEGKFVVSVGDRTFAFHLPLASLLPPRFDANTGEQFPGNYQFNPFTGDKLGNQKTLTPTDTTDKQTGADSAASAVRP